MFLKMSPADLEDKLTRIEDKSVLTLKNQNIIVRILLVAIIIYASFYLISAKLNIRYSFLYFSNFFFSFKTILLIAGLSVIGLFFKNHRFLLFWSLLVFLVCGVFDFYNSIWFQATKGVWAWFFLLAQVAIGGIVLAVRKKIPKSILVWGYIIIMVALFFLSYQMSSSAGWYYFHQPVLFVAFVVAVLLEDVDLSFSRGLKLLSNPTQLFLFVNYPIDSYLHKNELETWERGLVHFLKAMSALYLTCLIYQWLQTENLFLGSLRDYLMYLSVIVAVGNVITGISKLYFIDIPVCSNFAFLSRSPLDFMKRENAHAYIFSLRFFYFNFLKYTKSPLLIVLGYFLVFPFYRNILIFFSRPGDFSWVKFASFLGWGYLFWSLLLIMIIIYPEKYLKKNIPNEWWHVLFNHIVMYVVFLTYRYFFTIL